MAQKSDREKSWGGGGGGGNLVCQDLVLDVFVPHKIINNLVLSSRWLGFVLAQVSRKEAKKVASKGQQYLYWSWLWQEWRRRKGRSRDHPEDQSLHWLAWPAAESAPSLVVAGWIWRGQPSWRALRSPACCSDSCGSSASQASTVVVKFTKVWTFDQKTP